ncbi:hypothetical protein K469DRAFT_713776 [Zopfia rhizophila CBS 207.26]|uniref:VOC domain-containing protein n=1 Tax=Zopfia rhizophila CBS 207.26 TaxID=1314779 RepID=A0A6A6DT23_9PEZI|nr:hypothetical protein K469DRAFT_713776 [Zopfia rhizophila CBS 207.26]
MAPQKRVFISLPTADLTAAARFATALGLNKKTDWCSEEKSVFFEYGESLYLCYHDHTTFSNWLPSGRKISSSSTTTEVIVTLSAGSPEEVDGLIAKGIEAGGKRGPNMVPEMEKYGMHSRSVEDPDGHVFEIIYCEEKPKDEKKGENGEK